MKRRLKSGWINSGRKEEVNREKKIVNSEKKIVNRKMKKVNSELQIIVKLHH